MGDPVDSEDDGLGMRQRLESCANGIQQLEALRHKHRLLMEQLRRDYPSMGSLIGTEEETPFRHRTSSSSADSGYVPNHSPPTPPTPSDQPMDYSTFRKLSLEDRKESRPIVHSTHIVEATLQNLTADSRPSTSALTHFPSTSATSTPWSRLRSARIAERPRSCYGTAAERERNRGSRLLDSLAQLTPPPLSRKSHEWKSPTPMEMGPRAQIKSSPQREIPQIQSRTPPRPYTLQKAQLHSPDFLHWHSTTVTHLDFERWKRNVATITPSLVKSSSGHFRRNSETIISAAAKSDEIGGIAIQIPSRNPDRPIVRMRHPKQWNESQNL